MGCWIVISSYFANDYLTISITYPIYRLHITEAWSRPIYSETSMCMGLCQVLEKLYFKCRLALLKFDSLIGSAMGLDLLNSVYIFINNKVLNYNQKHDAKNQELEQEQEVKF